MAGMWGLGGLSALELLRRTVRETWEDEIFGRSRAAGLLPLHRHLSRRCCCCFCRWPACPGRGRHRQLLSGSFHEFLPARAAVLVAGAIRQLDANAHTGGPLLLAAAGSSIWASINACWAMIVGLNRGLRDARGPLLVGDRQNGRRSGDRGATSGVRRPAAGLLRRGNAGAGVPAGHPAQTGAVGRHGGHPAAFLSPCSIVSART